MITWQIYSALSCFDISRFIRGNGNT